MSPVDYIQATKLADLQALRKNLLNESCDVLLIQPSDTDDSVHWETPGRKEKGDIQAPLPLLQLAQVLLKENLKVTILDQRVVKDSFEIIDSILSKGVICVGLTFIVGDQIRYACDTMDYIKEKFPEVPIVVGGAHATVDYEITAKHESVDFLIRGQGEETFPKLVNLIKNKSSYEDYEKITGLVFKKDGKLIINDPPEFVDIEKYVKLPWHLVEKYPYGMSLVSSSGCPRRCTFCAVGIAKPRFIQLSIDNFIVQIKDVLAAGKKIFKEETPFIAFVDDTFFVSKERIDEFITKVKEYNLTFRWTALGHVVDLLRLGKDRLEALKSIGLVTLYVGIESGSPKVLNRLKKGINLVQIKKLNKLLGELNIHAWYAMITGFHFETREDHLETVDLVEFFKKSKTPIVFAEPRVFKPYPGTALFNEIKESGVKTPQTLREWGDLYWYKNKYVDTEIFKRMKW